MDRVIREINGTLLNSGPEFTDGQLLEMFRVRRNEAAFEAIVRRHGPMVLAVCRRILGNHHDAEDAFQATFLVLARRSGMIAPRDMAANWLHGVAVRTAQKARTQAAKIRTRELRAVLPVDSQSAPHEAEFDMRESLDRELARLPEKYRTPIVLCELEGKSHKEAARLLRWPEGTLSVRLMRAKKLLAQRLARQGIGTAGAIAILSAASAVPASVPSSLVSSSVNFATQFAVGDVRGAIPGQIAVLAEEVLRGLFMSKMKSLVASIVLLGLLFGGVAFSIRALTADSLLAKPVDALVAQAPEGPKEQKVEVPAEKSVFEGAKTSDPPRLDSFGDPLPEGVAARLGANRFCHELHDSRLAHSPDGKTLICCSVTGVIVWDAATGRELHRLKVAAGCVAFSPDGKTLALGERVERVPSVGLWDLRSGKKIKEFSPPEWKRDDARLDLLRFSPDGKHLVACCGESSSVVFDVLSGEVRMSLGGSDSFVCESLAVSPDGKALVAAVHPPSEEKIRHLRWWDFVTGQPIRTIQELPNGVKSMAFSPDGSALAIGMYEECAILLLDAETGKTTSRLKPEKTEGRSEDSPEVFDIAFAPDGKKLVAASRCDGDSAVRIWDLTSGKVVHVLSAREADGDSMSLSPDGKTVAFGQLGSVVRLWDVATGNGLFTEQLGHESLIRALVFSPDGKTLVSGGWFDQTFLWDWATKKRIGRLPAAAHGNGSCSFSPDGRRLATFKGSRSQVDNKIRVWDAATCKEVSSIAIPDERTHFTSAIFSSDGTKLFTLDRTSESYAQAVRHWDFATGRQEKQWPIPAAAYESFLLSDGKTVHYFGTDRGLHVYDAQKARLRSVSVERLEGYSPSPDGRIAFSHGTKQKVYQLSETCTGQQICTLKGLQRAVQCNAWSPDGRFVATGYGLTLSMTQVEEQSVRVWDTSTGKERAILGGFYSNVTALTFSPDGAFVLAGLHDGTILAWNLKERIPGTPVPHLSKDDLEARWMDLLSDKAAAAHEAIGVLVSAPEQAVRMLRDRLRPSPLANAGKIQHWIADLDSEQFAVREAASKELAKIDAQIEPYVREALKGNVSPETARRLERIVSTVDILDARSVRTIRAITVLERIGSSDAREVLQSLADGAPGSLATEEAAASLQRLARRK